MHNVDVETVLFLIGVSADVNSRIQDSFSRTPLHLAVNAGSEIIVRHLVSPLKRFHYSLKKQLKMDLKVYSDSYHCFLFLYWFFCRDGTSRKTKHQQEINNNKKEYE